jgi:glycosyltransferase involved in cell wall biosynthesis
MKMAIFRDGLGSHQLRRLSNDEPVTSGATRPKDQGAKMENSTCEPEPGTPRVSLALPVYNGERFLAECVESLLAQTYRDFELVIADNASSDATERMGRDFAMRDPRVRYIRRDTNLGAVANHNLLIGETASELIMWTGADDVHDPARLERLIDALDQQPDAVLAFSASREINGSGQVITTWHNDCRTDDPDPVLRMADLVRRKMDTTKYFYGVIRRSALEKTQLLSPVQYCDGILSAELSLLGSFAEVDEELLGHRKRDNPATEASAREWYQQQRAAKRMFLPNAAEGIWYLRAIWGVPLPRRIRMRALWAARPWLRQQAIPIVRNLARALITIGQEAVQKRRIRANRER